MRGEGYEEFWKGRAWMGGREEEQLFEFAGEEGDAVHCAPDLINLARK